MRRAADFCNKIGQEQTWALLDHRVGKRKQIVGECDAESLGVLEVTLRAYFERLRYGGATPILWPLAARAQQPNAGDRITQ
jgi:hypothetical protein